MLREEKKSLSVSICSLQYQPQSYWYLFSSFFSSKSVFVSDCPLPTRAPFDIAVCFLWPPPASPHLIPSTMCIQWKEGQGGVLFVFYGAVESKVSRHRRCFTAHNFLVFDLVMDEWYEGLHKNNFIYWLFSCTSKWKQGLHIFLFNEIEKKKESVHFLYRTPLLSPSEYFPSSNKNALSYIFSCQLEMKEKNAGGYIYIERKCERKGGWCFGNEVFGCLCGSCLLD